LSGGQTHGTFVANPRPDQRASNRCRPADQPGSGIGLVLADQRERAPLIRFVRQFDGCAEPDHFTILLPRRIDDLGLFHDLRQIAEPPIDLAQPLAAIDVVAILRTVAIARGPRDDLDQLRPLDPEQSLIFGLDPRDARRRDETWRPFARRVQ